jgi:hypothetical protein
MVAESVSISRFAKRYEQLCAISQVTPQRPDRLWGPPRLLSNGYVGAISPGVKRPWREAHHLTPPSAEVKDGGAVTPLPHMSA